MEFTPQESHLRGTISSQNAGDLWREHVVWVGSEECPKKRGRRGMGWSEISKQRVSFGEFLIIASSLHSESLFRRFMRNEKLEEKMFNGRGSTITC